MQSIDTEHGVVLHISKSTGYKKKGDSVTYAPKEILLVDDRKENLELLNSFLVQHGYKTRIAINGKLALASIRAKVPDLILLDIEMPDINGYEVCQMLKANPDTSFVPVIFVSAHSDVEAKVKAFQFGGVDYISKPFANEEVIARVKMHLDLAAYQHQLEQRVEESVSEIRRLNDELRITQKEMTLALGSIMETRDENTGRHVLRVATYAKLLASLYGVDEEQTNLIYEAAPFHDAGKVAIPDSILNKPSPLTPEEWEIMKTHTTEGYRIFKETTRPILHMCAIIAKEHHERWDGSGYPEGLKGEEIHIAGRITAVADVFDALTTKRSYKKAWSFEDASDYILSKKGSMFEPALVDLFAAHMNEFRKIYDELKD